MIKYCIFWSHTCIWSYTLVCFYFNHYWSTDQIKRKAWNYGLILDNNIFFLMLYKGWAYILQNHLSMMFMFTCSLLTLTNSENVKQAAAINHKFIPSHWLKRFISTESSWTVIIYRELHWFSEGFVTALIWLLYTTQQTY